MGNLEKIVTYVGGVIALAVILRNGTQVSNIITQTSKSLSMFAGTLLGGK